MKNAILLLQRFNNGLAVLAGGLLLLSVAVTLFDIIARQIGHSLGGTDELSGYAMAIATSWGMSYALTSLAHVRIDLVRSRVGSKFRAVFDAIALLALTGTAVVIAYRVWPVLEKSIQNQSTANTTLETPLWIPQSLWMAGWVWFAVTAIMLSTALIYYAVKKDFPAINNAVGITDES